MLSAQTSRPYIGSSRKLVLAFDVGTTCSGISYAILDPGQVPKLFTVTSFPGQSESGGDMKMPSVLYYDSDGVVRAVGQEAENLREDGEAEESEWIRVEWFKLHMRPKKMSASYITDVNVPPLPKNKTIVEVFADFLAYLFKCTKEHIMATHVSGDILLQSLEGQITFVLGHPNGWGGLQQQRMRTAAVLAKLIPTMAAAEESIQFVTEGEASLYYCLGNGLPPDFIKAGHKVTVIDAGGGTIDISSYVVKEAEPITVVEEVALPDCRLQGSVFVNQRASTFLSSKLDGSMYSDPEDIETIVACFEKNVKRRFNIKGVTQVCHIRFGTRNDNEPKYGITKGILKLTGEEISRFFNPSVYSILDAVYEQRRSGGNIKIVFLVGGFAASDYLFNSLREKLAVNSIEIFRPDSFSNKAVANGAVAFYLDHIVSSRMARSTYGTAGQREYDPKDLDHVSRTGSLTVQPSGCVMLPNAYFRLVSKGSKVSVEQEYTISLLMESRRFKGVVACADIIIYDGDSRDPLWTDVDSDSYRTLCTVRADISQEMRSLQLLRGPSGLYREFHFKVILKFGMTELKAQIAWMENGEERRSPASLVYRG